MPSPANIEFRSATDADVAGIVALWDAAGLLAPHNDPWTDIAFARRHPASDVIAGFADGQLIAACLVGHDGHRGSVYYVAVSPKQHGQGYGRRLMEAAESWLRVQGIWKLNLLVRKTNAQIIGFYQALDYLDDNTLQLSKRLRPMPYIEPDARLE